MVEIKIRAQGCKGCGLCVEACPKSLLALGDSINELGHKPVTMVKVEGCTGCGLCALMCPDMVIDIYK